MLSEVRSLGLLLAGCVLTASCGRTTDQQTGDSGGTAFDSAVNDSAFDSGTRPDSSESGVIPDSRLDDSRSDDTRDSGILADSSGGDGDTRAADSMADSYDATPADTPVGTCADAGFDPAMAGMVSHPCDGTGIYRCQQNYQCAVGDAGEAWATCVWYYPPRCVAADHCDDVFDAAALSSCRCGGGPACGPNEACVSDTEAGTPYCRCIVPGTCK
jgi:hypothetical protein